MSATDSFAIARRLRALTPARVGLARTGVSQQTCDLLDFQRAHAQARDAVHARMDAGAVSPAIGAVCASGVVRLHSAATDRATYLQRPDLGRILDATSREVLTGLARDHVNEWDIALIVADGLSALAVERHAVPLLERLLPRLNDCRVAPICVVEQGRVAIGDEIGAVLGVNLSIVLIGERPGLSSPDSLGAYVTWGPRQGRTDAERNCISNIRSEGLTYETAATELESLLALARARRLTGVELKQYSRTLAEGCRPA